MRALDSDVFDAVWAAVKLLLPSPPKTHPLGCHRPRASDRVCLRAMLIRLLTGCSWVDAEQLVNRAVSDTTLRARRDEWERAGIFATVVEEALAAYDKIIGLDLSDVAVDGSQHKAPRGAREQGRTPLIGGNAGGSGRFSRTRQASLSDGRPTVPSATTRSCSLPPSMPSNSEAS